MTNKPHNQLNITECYKNVNEPQSISQEKYTNKMYVFDQPTFQYYPGPTGSGFCFETFSGFSDNMVVRYFDSPLSAGNSYFKSLDSLAHQTDFSHNFSSKAPIWDINPRGQLMQQISYELYPNMAGHHERDFLWQLNQPIINEYPTTIITQFSA
jgi:hypothetical protein